MLLYEYSLVFCMPPVSINDCLGRSSQGCEGAEHGDIHLELFAIKNLGDLVHDVAS